MPPREYALQSISLSFGHRTNTNMDDDGVILIVGRSGSGKSTLLRLLSGIECPNYDGSIVVNDQAISNATTTIRMATSTKTMMPGIPSWVKMGIVPLQTGLLGTSQPVILEGKPDFDDSLTVMERIVQVGEDAVRRCIKYPGWNRADAANNAPATIPDEATIAAATTTMLQLLAEDVSSLLTLTTSQISCRPSELSPSGEYLFGIACGCMMSMAPSIVVAASNFISNGGDHNDECAKVHYPILLFDELFDTEHPSIVESCARGILNLIRAGGVIVSATHRPAHFCGMAARTITLSGGKVLGRILDETA
jgi:energy-coupling factor transporter ATP-binding protein EcfA2